MALLILLLLCLSIFIEPSLANASTYYVAKSGSDSMSCAQSQSQATPQLTIAAGLACLASGDTLSIKTGVYAESFDVLVPSGTASAPTIIKSFGTDDVIIRPTAVGPANDLVRFLGSRSYITLKGSLGHPLIIDGVNATPPAGSQAQAIRLQDSVHHIVLEYLEIKNNSYQGIAMNGAGSITTHHITIRNCHIHDNGLAYPGDFHIHGIYLKGEDHIVENCHIHHHTGGYGIHQNDSRTTTSNRNIFRSNLVHDIEVNGILAGSGAGNLVYNNIVYNADVGIQIGYGSTTNTQVYNNTVYQCAVFISFRTTENLPTGTIIRNNVGWQNTNNTIVNNGAEFVASNNLTTVNPSFVNAPTDFHLQLGSAAKNFGMNLSSIFTKDYDGVTRPASGAWDAGAYEFGSGSSPDTSAPAAPTSLQVR